ncbi:50S ribosomal protein L17 [Candidatus Peregrinibacteria bacterium]|nr:50S ribosomal protein L17 [Candidatus Peregrinibacteria bacterium]
MRHRHSRLRLRQKPAHARLMKRNLVTSMILYERVRTTKKRAEVMQPMIDKLITVAKKHPPHLAIRSINQVLTDKNASRKVMEILIKRYADRPSGLTRIVPVGSRKGDGAELVDFMFVEGKPVESAKDEVPSAKEKTKVSKKSK